MDITDKLNIVSRVKESLEDYCGEINYMVSPEYRNILNNKAYWMKEDGLTQRISIFYDFTKEGSSLLETCQESCTSSISDVLQSYMKKGEKVTHVLMYEDFKKSKSNAFLYEIKDFVPEIVEESIDQDDKEYLELTSYGEAWRRACSKCGYWIDIYKPWEEGDGPGSGSPFD